VLAGSAIRAGGTPAASGRVCHEAWPRLSLGMNSPTGTEPLVERRWASALSKESARRDRQVAEDTDLRSSAFRFLFLSFLAEHDPEKWIPVFRKGHALLEMWLEAKIVRCRCPPLAFSDEDRCGERNICSLIAALDDDSGADRIAGTRSFASPLPACGERSSAARVRGPLRESELSGRSAKVR
jgi:hypothetical protein